MDAGGRVVTLAVTAPVVHSTRLCMGRGEKGWGEVFKGLGESRHADVPLGTAWEWQWVQTSLQSPWKPPLALTQQQRGPRAVK